MYLPQQTQITKSQNYINVFGGYNHQARINDSEFYDMKNMTADQYPVLSSRDPRNYELQIASSEYEDIEAVIERKFVEESLTKRMAVYTVTADTEGGCTYEIEYTVDDELVAEYEQKNEYLIRGELFHYKGKVQKQFTVSDECTKAVITITATWNGDEDSWKEENLSKFVYGIKLKKKNESIRAMTLKNGKLAYLIKNTIYWNGQEFDFSEYADTREQQMISYGAYILVFPMGIYLNTNDTTDRGHLGARSESRYKVTYSVCNLAGADYNYTLSEKAPEEPEDGQYWMRQAEEDALYQWSESLAMWTAVTTTYIKILTNDPECFDKYEVDDAITIEESDVESLNGINTIVAKGTTETGSYIVVTGVMEKTTEQTTKVKFERKIPVLDYVCVSNNRVWGCHYGLTDGEMLNEIYACKLGDPKNWYSYQGTALDSYALSLGDDGEFTGAYTYQGYPLFFKENNIYKIYGTYPAAYQLTTYDCRGIQKGSHKSIAVVDEYLVYKSINDICVFDGNYPISLSAKLGKRRFTECAAGAYMSKYYISMKDEKGHAIYVYDFNSSLWVRDEEMQIEEFVSTKSGELYGRTKVGIICFGNENDNLGLQEKNAEQEKVEWYAESGTYGIDLADKKRIGEIKIRAAIHHGARMKVAVYYDDSGKWNEYWVDKAGINSDGKIRSFTVPIIPVSCDTMKMKLYGVGKIEIYSILREVEK